MESKEMQLTIDEWGKDEKKEENPVIQELREFLSDDVSSLFFTEPEKIGKVTEGCVIAGFGDIVHSIAKQICKEKNEPGSLSVDVSTVKDVKLLLSVDEITEIFKGKTSAFLAWFFYEVGLWVGKLEHCYDFDFEEEEEAAE